MITKYKNLFEQKEVLKHLKDAIKNSKGRIVCIIHPFTSSFHGYPEEYRKRIRKIVRKSKFPVFLFIERTVARGSDLPGRARSEERRIEIYEKKLYKLFGRGFEKNKEIIIVRTHELDPTPLPIGEEKFRTDAQKRLANTLTELGVRLILLGGERGHYLKETKSLEDRGCVNTVSSFIQRYSKIKVTTMPEMLWDEDEIEFDMYGD